MLHQSGTVAGHVSSCAKRALLINMAGQMAQKTLQQEVREQVHATVAVLMCVSVGFCLHSLHIAFQCLDVYPQAFVCIPFHIASCCLGVCVLRLWSAFSSATPSVVLICVSLCFCPDFLPCCSFPPGSQGCCGWVWGSGPSCSSCPMEIKACSYRGAHCSSSRYVAGGGGMSAGLRGNWGDIHKWKQAASVAVSCRSHTV